MFSTAFPPTDLETEQSEQPTTVIIWEKLLLSSTYHVPNSNKQCESKFLANTIVIFILKEPCNNKSKKRQVLAIGKQLQNL